MVKSVKDILKKTIWKAKISNEEMRTLLTEAERVINMRPLTYLSDDPMDLSPLTPEKFLSGNFESTGDGEEVLTNSSDIHAKWKSRVRYTSFLWKRWRCEYLRLLRSAHHSSKRVTRDIQLGDVVLVHDAKPRINWRLGMIETCFPGRDNKVRACELRLADGKRMRRPVQLLYPLEIHHLPPPEDVKN